MSLDIYVKASVIDTVYQDNITHNLAIMAQCACVYELLWNSHGTKCKEMILPLAVGLNRLISHPKYFSKFNPSNNWGDYSQLVDCVKNLLAKCKEFPNGIIHTWK